MRQRAKCPFLHRKSGHCERYRPRGFRGQPPGRAKPLGISKTVLAMVRLGMATSLFTPCEQNTRRPRAHSLRVALSCSAWCERLGLENDQRDRIEVAALLHDIGKIGIPDRVLRKPGKLTVEEQMSMDVCAEIGCEILRGCTDDQTLLDIVRYNSTWFEIPPSRRFDARGCVAFGRAHAVDRWRV